MSKEARLATKLTDQAAPRPGQHQPERLPIEGKAVLILEDEPLVAMNVELCLLDAGAAVVKIANSIASAKSALDECIPFDTAVVDLALADGNASTLIQLLAERGIAVVITTGYGVDRGQPALGRAVAILQKPHTDSDLINAIQQSMAAASIT